MCLVGASRALRRGAGGRRGHLAVRGERLCAARRRHLPNPPDGRSAAGGAHRSATRPIPGAGRRASVALRVEDKRPSHLGLHRRRHLYRGSAPLSVERHVPPTTPTTALPVSLPLGLALCPAHPKRDLGRRSVRSGLPVHPPGSQRLQLTGGPKTVGPKTTVGGLLFFLDRFLPTVFACLPGRRGSFREAHTLNSFPAHRLLAPRLPPTLLPS